MPQFLDHLALDAISALFARLRSKDRQTKTSANGKPPSASALDLRDVASAHRDQLFSLAFAGLRS
jgi:hypothetical protein